MKRHNSAPLRTNKGHRFLALLSFYRDGNSKLKVSSAPPWLWRRCGVTVKVSENAQHFTVLYTALILRKISTKVGNFFLMSMPSKFDGAYTHTNNRNLQYPSVQFRLPSPIYKYLRLKEPPTGFERKKVDKQMFIYTLIIIIIFLFSFIIHLFYY